MLLDVMVLAESGVVLQLVFLLSLPLILSQSDGLIYGDYHLFAAQIIGIIFTIAVAVVGTLICVAIVRIFTPLRVSVREEQVGLDISEHGESAYPSFNGLDQ